MTLAVLIFIAGALAMSGCTSPAAREREAATRRYEKQANVKFAEADVRIRLMQQVIMRFPEEVRRQREALYEGKKIVGPQFLGIANFGYPETPISPLTKVWVVAIIDASGTIAHVECHGEGDAGVASSHRNLITTTVRGWKFRPMLIEGQPSSCVNIFPVQSDGVKFYVSSPKELE